MLQDAASPAGSRPAHAVPDLDAAELRAALRDAAIEATVNLADVWRLGSRQMTALLDLASEGEWFAIKAGHAPQVPSKDLLLRISALVGIYKGLHLLFSEPLVDDWIRIPNTEALFAGRSPVDHMMLNGTAAMIRTRAYIDALRGGL